MKAKEIIHKAYQMVDGNADIITSDLEEYTIGLNALKTALEQVQYEHAWKDQERKVVLRRDAQTNGFILPADMINVNNVLIKGGHGYHRLDNVDPELLGENSYTIDIYEREIIQPSEPPITQIVMEKQIMLSFCYDHIMELTVYYQKLIPAPRTWEDNIPFEPSSVLIARTCAELTILNLAWQNLYQSRISEYEHILDLAIERSKRQSGAFRSTRYRDIPKDVRRVW